MTLPVEDFIRENTRVSCPAIVPEVRLYMATEGTPLWKMTKEDLQQALDEPPFWAFAWPGSQGLARYILDNPGFVKDKRVVDFASGCGLAAIAAMLAGAKSALAIDIDPIALVATGLNAEINGVKVKTKEIVDMTKPFSKADILVAGDVCYQQAMSAAVVRWLRYCVEEDKTVFLADPGRAYVPEDGMKKITAYDVPVPPDLETCKKRTVTIWQMEKILDPSESLKTALL